MRSVLLEVSEGGDPANTGRHGTGATPPINPDPVHARCDRSGGVVIRLVAHVERLRRPGAQRLQGVLEDAGVGLGRPDLAGDEDGLAEESVEACLPQFGPLVFTGRAVGDDGETVPRTGESLQHRQGILIGRVEVDHGRDKASRHLMGDAAGERLPQPLLLNGQPPRSHLGPEAQVHGRHPREIGAGSGQQSVGPTFPWVVGNQCIIQIKDISCNHKE